MGAFPVVIQVMDGSRTVLYSSAAIPARGTVPAKKVLAHGLVFGGVDEQAPGNAVLAPFFHGRIIDGRDHR